MEEYFIPSVKCYLALWNAHTDGKLRHILRYSISLFLLWIFWIVFFVFWRKKNTTLINGLNVITEVSFCNPVSAPDPMSPYVLEGSISIMNGPEVKGTVYVPPTCARQTKHFC